MVRAGSEQRDRDQQDLEVSLSEIYWHCCSSVLREGGWEVNSDTEAKGESLRGADLARQAIRNDNTPITMLEGNCFTIESNTFLRA